MSKINLASQSWSDIVFEGRNKSYGAYRLRANLGRRQLRAVLIVIATLVAFIVIGIVKKEVQKAIESDIDLSETTTQFSELKKEKPKEKEEPKVVKPEPQKIEKVAVKASIEFTVPKIVDDDKVDESKALKTQREVNKSTFDVASVDYKGDSKNGINIDDLKDNQQAGGTTVPTNVEEKVIDNAIVDVPATYPGGEAAIINFIKHNLHYPEIALDQNLQGTVVLRFKVSKDGSVSDVQVKKSLSRECDQEAIKCVKKLNRFIPAKSNGKPVPVWFTLPIQFRIE